MPAGRRVRELAKTYHDRRPRRGRPPVESYVRVMYDAYRGRRVDRLLEIVRTVGDLAPDGRGAGPESDEAWELVGGRSSGDDTAGIDAWRGALFAVLARDALNQGDWVGDLRLRWGQRAVVLADEDGDPEPGESGGRGASLAVSVEEGAELTEFERQALAAVELLRAAVAAHREIRVLKQSEIPTLPAAIKEVLGYAGGDVPAAGDGDPFEGVISVGTGLPVLAVPLGDGQLFVCEHLEPWQAIAEAQEVGSSFGEAIATGVLMMSADAGIATVPPAVISPDGVAHIIERPRQHGRLHSKLGRWVGLVDSARRRLPS